jgi:hypothetical protein
MLLDTDITLTADIGELWSYFNKFAKKQVGYYLISVLFIRFYSI